MQGADVTELLNLLVKKKYLVFLDSTVTVATGESTYDTTMEDAVKRFQTDHKLKADGVVGTTTVYYLKKDE